MTVPVIIDTDPGIDDAIAIALAAASPELEIIGVTTVSGNTSLHNGTENALRLLHLLRLSAPRPELGLRAGLLSLLMMDYVASPRSILRDVHALEPGTFWLWEVGDGRPKLTVQQWHRGEQRQPSPVRGQPSRNARAPRSGRGVAAHLCPPSIGRVWHEGSTQALSKGLTLAPGCRPAA